MLLFYSIKKMQLEISVHYRARQPMTMPSSNPGRTTTGFPSPAEDYQQPPLDLNHYCVANPQATFFVRVEGDAMTGAGIRENDLLIVDRSLPATDRDIVVAVINGEFTLKRLRLRHGRVSLHPENPAYQPLVITADMEFTIWGRVTRIIRDL